MSQRTLFSTLIGINEYPTEKSRLNGCVKDALDFDIFLRKLCAGQPQGNPLLYKPLYLLAPNQVDRDTHFEKHKILTKSDHLLIEAPTFGNVTTKAFGHLKQAKDGDICLLLYCGHGSQVKAPPEFQHIETNGMNQTIVCLDSRNGARDLIDKEIAYLLWDALAGKNVHCLVVMGCCFAGNNTRNYQNIRFRHEPAGGEVAFKEYLGFSQGFFDPVTDGKATIKIADYIQLAASQENEEALETTSGGLFTQQLLAALRSGGSTQSYRTLMKGVSLIVSNRRSTQTPIAFARDDQQLNTVFLGGGFVPYQATFAVMYKALDGSDQFQWVLEGGAMHGLLPSTEQAYTQVLINGSPVNVAQVYADHSTLDQRRLSSLRPGSLYEAKLYKMGSPAVKVGISKELWEHGEKLKALKKSVTAHPYAAINFDSSDTAADYLIRLTEEKSYVLTRSNSEIPLFKREQDASTFLHNTNAVGKWTNALELQNQSPAFTMDDFEFALEIIEGVKLNKENVDMVTGRTIKGPLPEEASFFYKHNEQPAFRLSIKIKDESGIKDGQCYVGALFLKNMFGIASDFIRDGLIKKGSAPKYLEYYHSNKFYRTFPLKRGDCYDAAQTGPSPAYIKIIVADKPIDLQGFAQAGLQCDEKWEMHPKSGPDDVAQQTQWSVFTLKIWLRDA